MRRALIRKYKRFKKWAIPELKRRFSSTQEIPYKDTPIVINNFNRIDTLLILIKGLETRGYNNIYIISNYRLNIILNRTSNHIKYNLKSYFKSY